MREIALTAARAKEMVEKVEGRYGKADRIWVMDRGMVSEKIVEFLRSEGRRYIVGTPRGQLRQFREQLSSQERWETIMEGLSANLIVAKVERNPSSCVAAWLAPRRRGRTGGLRGGSRKA